MPALQKLHGQFSPQGFTVLGISIDDEGRKKVEAFIKKHQIAYPILLDAETNPAWETYKVKVIPAMFLVDQQGQIVRQWIGEADMKEVENAAASLLAKKKSSLCKGVTTPILHCKAKTTTQLVSATKGKSGFDFYMCKIKVLRNFFKLPALAIFAHVVPRKIFAVHRNVNAVRQRLHERQRAAEIEQAVRAAERIRNHRAGEDDGFLFNMFSQHLRRFHHRVGAVGDDNFIFRRFFAMLQNELPVGVGHLETVDHHDGAQIDFQTAAPELQHFVDVRVFEIQRAVDFVVLFVKRPAGDEDFDGHGRPLKRKA